MTASRVAGPERRPDADGCDREFTTASAYHVAVECAGGAVHGVVPEAARARGTGSAGGRPDDGRPGRGPAARGRGTRGLAGGTGLLRRRDRPRGPRVPRRHPV